MDGPSLPRSMRWRLQLGVFKLPPLFIPGNEVVEGEEELLKWSFSDLWQCNSDICQELRWEYTRLKQEWMVFRSEQQSQSLSLTENNKEQQSSNLSSSTGSLSLLDPLSAFAKEKTAEKKRLEELELKYKREKALRKRGMYNEDDDDNDNENEYSSFASSLSLIEKDLNRLPPDHHEYHHKRRMLFLEKNDDEEEEEYNIAIQERTLRLTEMLQIYAKQHPHIGYRQGMHELISYCLLVVEMDVYKYEMMRGSSNANTAAATSKTNDNKKEEEEEGWDTSIETPKHEFWDGSYLAHDAYGIFQVLMDPLAPAYDVNNNYNNGASASATAAETRGQAILELIRTVASDQSLYRHLMQLQCPPELYTTRWIRLLFSREVHGKSNVLLLWDVFMDLWSVVSSPPHPITNNNTTASNNNNNAITRSIKITSLSPGRYTRPGVSPPLQLGNWNLLEILETTAASMILLQRGSLLSSNIGETEDGEMDGYSQSDSIHRLMNIPPLKNILPLTATLLSMMRRRQVMIMKKKNMTNTTSKQQLQKQQQQQQTHLSNNNNTKKQSLLLSAQQNNNNNNRSNNTIDNNNNNIIRTSSVSSSSSRNVFTEMADAVEKFSLWKQPSPPINNNKKPIQQQSSNNNNIDLANQLNESISSIRKFLLQLESPSNNNNSDLVPTSIWNALEQMETVQKQLKQQQEEQQQR